jgi:hypothetical protein
MSNFTIRLNKNNNNNKENTFQSKLTSNQIKDYLKDYKIVTDINKVNISTHIRYFCIDPITKIKKFRLGGILTKFGDNREYIILSNGASSWSVQLKNTIFYQKMTECELKEELKEELKKEIMTEENCSENNIKLKNDLKILEKKYKILEKKNESLSHLLSTKENEIKSILKKNNLLSEQLDEIKNEILKIKKKNLN